MAEEIKQRSSQTRVRKGSFGEIVKLEKEKHAEMVERERLDRKKKQRLAAKRKRKVLRKAKEEEKAAEKEKLKPKKAVKAKDSKNKCQVNL